MTAKPTIGIIYGENSAAAGSFDFVTLAESLGAGCNRTGNGILAPNWTGVERVLKETTAENDPPALVLAILNGRAGGTSQPLRPLHLAGRPNDLRDLMFEATVKSENRPGPVDVFMLISTPPGFIHDRVHLLPAGSTVVAVQTDTDSARTNKAFWELMQRDGMHGAVTPSARSLLVSYLLTHGSLARLPEIAVSGQPGMSLADMWDKTVASNSLCKDARTALRAYNPFVSELTRDHIAQAQSDISNGIGGTPRLAAHYALALLNHTALTRHAIAKPSEATPAIWRKPSRPIEVDTTPASHTGASGHQKRISPADIAAAPKFMRDALAVNKRLARQILGH